MSGLKHNKTAVPKGRHNNEQDAICHALRYRPVQNHDCQTVAERPALVLEAFVRKFAQKRSMVGRETDMDLAHYIQFAGSLLPIHSLHFLAGRVENVAVKKDENVMMSKIRSRCLRLT